MTDRIPARLRATAAAGCRMARTSALAALMAMATAVLPAQAQTVTLAQGVDPESLDPAYDTLISSVGIMMNIYDALVWRDAEGNVVPALAESWEFPQPDQMLIRLRQGVTFHNGDPFTADDVVFSFEWHFNPDSRSLLVSALRDFVASVEKIDDHTVIIHMPGPRATIVPTLVRVPILPAAAFAAIGSAEFGTRPIGTGPFRFVEWRRNEAIVLERNADYWRGPAAIERYVIRPVPEEFSRFASLVNGEVDIIANLTAERAGEVQANAALRVASVPSVRNMFVGLDTRRPPFDDLRVRQAMNHAVDKEALIEVILGGFAVENASVCTQTLFGAAPVEPFAYDPDRARALLAEAGYPDGFSVAMLGPVGRYAKDKELQEAIAGMLADVGVQITHVQPEWAEFLRLWREQLHEMLFVGTGNQVMDCDQHLGYRIHGPRYGRQYQSDEVDALIGQQMAEYDLDRRKAILAEIQQKVRDDAPWIFLFDNMDVYGMSARIDWTPRPDEMVWAYEIAVTD